VYLTSKVDKRREFVPSSNFTSRPAIDRTK
jgi:hypothetical protein